MKTSADRWLVAHQECITCGRSFDATHPRYGRRPVDEILECLECQRFGPPPSEVEWPAPHEPKPWDPKPGAKVKDEMDEAYIPGIAEERESAKKVS